MLHSLNWSWFYFGSPWQFFHHIPVNIWLLLNDVSQCPINSEYQSPIILSKSFWHNSYDKCYVNSWNSWWLDSLIEHMSSLDRSAVTHTNLQWKYSNRAFTVDLDKLSAQIISYCYGNAVLLLKYLLKTFLSSSILLCIHVVLVHHLTFDITLWIWLSFGDIKNV